MHPDAGHVGIFDDSLHRGIYDSSGREEKRPEMQKAGIVYVDDARSARNAGIIVPRTGFFKQPYNHGIWKQLKAL